MGDTFWTSITEGISSSNPKKPDGKSLRSYVQAKIPYLPMELVQIISNYLCPSNSIVLINYKSLYGLFSDNYVAATELFHFLSKKCQKKFKYKTIPKGHYDSNGYFWESFIYEKCE